MHRHEKLAPESGVKLRPMAPISGAAFWNVYQVPYVRGLSDRSASAAVRMVA